MASAAGPALILRTPSPTLDHAFQYPRLLRLPGDRAGLLLRVAAHVAAEEDHAVGRELCILWTVEPAADHPALDLHDDRLDSGEEDGRARGPAVAPVVAGLEHGVQPGTPGFLQVRQVHAGKFPGPAQPVRRDIHA